MDKIPVMAIENIGMVSEKLYRNTLNRQKNKNIQPDPKKTTFLLIRKVCIELEKIFGKFHSFSDEEIAETLPKKNENTRKVGVV